VSNAALFAGRGTYSFDIADGRIREIYVVRNPRQAAWVPRAHALSAGVGWQSTAITHG
jgi:hypothetical protein